jgi:polynucleotide 5'-kinase involved in rRNA processing
MPYDQLMSICHDPRSVSLSTDTGSESYTSSDSDDSSSRENVIVENPRLPRQPSSRLDVIKTFLNVVVIGHVDHGKSTLIGHMA